jgi:hypothetical protein
MSERPAQPGERCTCGRQAVTVFVREDGSEVGYCGRPDSGEQGGPCPFCGGGRHEAGRCPQYRLRPEQSDSCVKISPGLRLTCLQSLAEGWITPSDLCPVCTSAIIAALDGAMAWHPNFRDRAAAES